MEASALSSSSLLRLNLEGRHVEGRGKVLQTALLIAASVAAFCFESLESMVSFWSSDDFTTANLLVLFMEYATGVCGRENLLLRNQMKSLETCLEEALCGTIGEFCGAPTKDMSRRSSMPFETIIDKQTITEECSVCLEGFRIGQRAKHLSRCQHLFHQCCIDQWLVIQSSCPVCRSHVF